MSDWYQWIQNIAAERIDAVERHMLARPDEFPDFCEASRELDAVMTATEDLTDQAAKQREEAWVKYIGALAIEMYLAGARDGGRVYHAFTTGELPTIQKQEDEHD